MYIFDIDGTLLDTVDSITNNVNHALKAFGLKEVSREKIRSFVGDGPKVLIERVTSFLGVNDESLREDLLNFYNKYYDDNPTYLTKAYDGITDQLDILKKRGEIITAFSNKPDSTSKKVLNEVIGKEYFDMILGFKEEIQRKPSPEGIYIIAERFGAKMTDIIYFGDSEVDIKCGKNAGVFTVACSRGFRPKDFLLSQKPDAIIDEVEDITKIRRI
jgi:phosphoglycolate phosphatase